MTKMRVTCPLDGDVIITAAVAVIDDEEHVYRFTCSGPCGGGVEKAMDYEIRRLLRDAGVPTVDEVVASARLVLHDDDALHDVLDSFD